MTRRWNPIVGKPFIDHGPEIDLPDLGPRGADERDPRCDPALIQGMYLGALMIVCGMLIGFLLCHAIH